MNRIEAIYSFIDIKDRVVDVGCDQAKLGVLLSKRGQSSIASDISSKVIEKAKKDNNNPLIDFRVSNGLEKIKEGEVDTLVLSGMGSHTIIEILSNTKLKFNKIITISNNYHDILRRELLKLGYIVDIEQIVLENNKYYNLIVFKQGTTSYTESDLLLGLNHKDISLYKEYLEYCLNKSIKIKEQAQGKNEKIDNIINIINEKLKSL